MKKNLFIALEGIDGSGKSTQVKMLAETLSNAGHKVYTTFEPTKSDMGVMIRDIFSGKTEADQGTIAALFLADRFNHILNKTDGLLKKMEEGYTVITDRYYFSSYAYHSVHMPMNWVIAMNKPCAELLRPDITVYIDILPEVSMNRINENRESTELYETLENLTAVRNKYLEAFEILKEEEKVFITEGNRLPEIIADDISNMILGL
jgi:dTMP kinase